MNDHRDDTITELQSRIAFLDQELVAMRDSVDAHQRQILTLEANYRLLAERLADAIQDSERNSDGAQPGIADERPPHY